MTTNTDRVYSEEFLLQFKYKVAPRADISEMLGATHPCSRYPDSNPCKFGDRCIFREMPRHWCLECLRGDIHDFCWGSTPDLHPCLRVWDTCKYGDSCVFKDCPRIWCLFCLRGDKTHQKCSGWKPRNMPNHLKEVSKEAQEKETGKRERKESCRGPRNAKSACPPARCCTCGDTRKSNDNNNRSAFGTTVQRSVPSKVEPEVTQAQTELPNRAQQRFGGATEKPKHGFLTSLKALQGTLNKLTPDTFEAKLPTILDLVGAGFSDWNPSLSAEHPMHVFAKKIHEQVLTGREPDMFARLIAEVTKNVNSEFKKGFMDVMQAFYGSQPDTVPPPRDEAEVPEYQAEVQRLADLHRKKARNNIKFIGTLFVHHLFPNKVLVQVFKNSLNPQANSHRWDQAFEDAVILAQVVNQAQERLGEFASILGWLNSNVSSISSSRVKFELDDLNKAVEKCRPMPLTYSEA